MNKYEAEFIAEQQRRVNPSPVISDLEEMIEDDYKAWIKSGRSPVFNEFLKSKFRMEK